MTKDPVLACFLLAMFGLSFVAGSVRYSATTRLAKWLYQHRRDVWRELGRPGTTFFKGEPDNGYLSRTSALQFMGRIMPLRGYRKQLADDEVERCFRQHRLAGRFSVVFLMLFAAGIFYGVARDQSRRETPLHKPEMIKNGQAVGK